MSGVPQKTERNSSIELLRIFCIVGIVIMHTNGNIMADCTGINLIWCQLENGIFQAGVSIFVLISGYFGIRTTFQKVAKLELDILFYSVLGGVLTYLLFDDSLTSLAKSFLPISTNKYWFLTGYMLIMIFAPWLNRAAESLTKSSFERMLLLMFAVFSFLPTFLYFDVMQAGGKNVVNMLFLYFLGRYLKKYGKERYSTKFLVLCLLSAYVMSVGLNMISSYVTGGVGAHIPMSRDCTAFIVIEAVCIFLLFKQMQFYSPTVNRIAKHVIAVYMFESMVRTLLTTYLYDWTIYQDAAYWSLVSVGVAIVATACCIGLDVLKRYTIEPIENKLVNVLNALWTKILDKCKLQG